MRIGRFTAVILFLALLVLAVAGSIRAASSLNPSGGRHHRVVTSKPGPFGRLMGEEGTDTMIQGSVEPCAALFASTVQTGSSPLRYTSLYAAVNNFLAAVPTGCADLQTGLQIYLMLRNIAPTSSTAPKDVQLAYQLSRNINALATPSQCRTTANQQLATQFLIAADAPGCTPGFPGNCAGAACVANLHPAGLVLNGGGGKTAQFETLLQLVGTIVNPPANFSNLMFQKAFAHQAIAAIRAASSCNPLYATLAANLQTTLAAGIFPAPAVVQNALDLLSTLC